MTPSVSLEEMNTVALIGYAAAVVLTGMSIPQTVRAHRYGVQGVSTATWLTIAIAMSMWLAYGIRNDSLVLVIANVAALVATAAMLVVLARSRGKSLAVAVVGVVGFLVVANAIALVAPLGLVTVAAVLLPIASRVPQMLVCVGSYRSATATSVSRSTWMMSALGQSLWLAYGLILNDPALIIVNAVCVALTFVLLAADYANPGNRNRDAVGLLPRHHDLAAAAN